MRHDDTPLDHEARALLQAGSRGDDPSAADERRIWSRLEPKVLAGAAIVMAGAAPQSAAAAGLFATATKVGATIVLAVGVAGGAWWGLRTRTEPASVPVTPPVPAAPEPAAAAPAPVPSAPPTRPAVSPVLARLEDESRLLREAHAALRDGNPRRALELATEHERRHPDGVLRPERLATRVFALCAQGDRRSARREAAEFVRRYPHSPLAADVRRACR